MGELVDLQVRIIIVTIKLFYCIIRIEKALQLSCKSKYFRITNFDTCRDAVPYNLILYKQSLCNVNAVAILHIAQKKWCSISDTATAMPIHKAISIRWLLIFRP